MARRPAGKPVRVSMTRGSNVGIITLEIEDSTVTPRVRTRVEMTAENFGLAVTGLSARPAELFVKRVGGKHDS